MERTRLGMLALAAGAVLMMGAKEPEKSKDAAKEPAKTEKPADKPAEKQGEKPAEKPGEKPEKSWECAAFPIAVGSESLNPARVEKINSGEVKVKSTTLPDGWKPQGAVSLVVEGVETPHVVACKN